LHNFLYGLREFVGTQASDSCVLAKERDVASVQSARCISLVHMSELNIYSLATLHRRKLHIEQHSHHRERYLACIARVVLHDSFVELGESNFFGSDVVDLLTFEYL
jgi:hypothetical protein